MQSNRMKLVTCLLAVCFGAVVSSFALPQAAKMEKIKTTGMITDRAGELMVIRGSAGTSYTVVLDDGTKVQQPVGLGLTKNPMSAAVLIPGLKINVDGTYDAQGRIVAKSITFSGTDLRIAEMIQAGLNPTQNRVSKNEDATAANQQNIDTNKQNIGANGQAIDATKTDVAANKAVTDANTADIRANDKRFEDLTNFDVKGDIAVRFAVSSSKISADDQAALKKLAGNAVGLTGYLIEVKGFADSSGNATMNQKLSQSRAQAVIAYLLQNCNVPIRHIVAPGAMGISNPAASNETSSGRAENRRVEVKVLVNRGLAGQ